MQRLCPPRIHRNQAVMKDSFTEGKSGGEWRKREIYYVS
jgi:hypothetical protein